MARKNDPTKINIHIDHIEPFGCSDIDGIIITWSSDIGFGEYTLYKYPNEDVWHADSECMDCNEDKAFLQELLKLFLESVKIEG